VKGAGSEWWRGKAGWALLLFLFIVAVSFRPLAQAIRPEPPGVKVTLWHSQRGREREVLERLLRRFNREHAGEVYVQPLGVPDGSFKDKLIRNVPRGSGPDLFIRPHNELGELFAEGVVAPVPPRNLPVPPAQMTSRKLLDGLSVGDGCTACP
jgi:maltose-binding protein MalE